MVIISVNCFNGVLDCRLSKSLTVSAGHKGHRLRVSADSQVDRLFSKSLVLTYWRFDLKSADRPDIGNLTKLKACRLTQVMTSHKKVNDTCSYIIRG